MKKRFDYHRFEPLISLHKKVHKTPSFSPSKPDISHHPTNPKNIDRSTYTRFAFVGEKKFRLST